MNSFKEQNQQETSMLHVVAHPSCQNFVAGGATHFPSETCALP